MTYHSAFQDGLLAAKAGKRMIARLQFEQVVQLAPDFVPGLLWLAWTADSPTQAAEHLAKANTICPDDRLVQVFQALATGLAEYEYDSEASATSTPTASADSAPAAEVQRDSVSSTRETLHDADTPVAQTAAEASSAPADEETPVATTTSGQASVSSDISQARAQRSEPETDSASDVLPSETPAEQTDTGARDLESIAEPPTTVSTTGYVSWSKNASEDSADRDDPPSDAHPQEPQPLQAEQNSDRAVPEVSAPTLASESARDQPSAAEPATAPASPPEALEDTKQEAALASHVDALNQEVKTAIDTASDSGSTTAPTAQVVVDSAAPRVAEPVLNDAPTILAVDDSPTVRKLVTMTLMSAGYNVETAEDGVEAMKLIAEMTPDLILLDINMPKVDGYKLCKLLKRHDKTKSIPVIMLSGKDGMFDKLRGTLVGCDDYISKPFRSVDLIEHLERYVGVPA